MKHIGILTTVFLACTFFSTPIYAESSSGGSNIMSMMSSGGGGACMSCVQSFMQSRDNAQFLQCAMGCMQSMGGMSGGSGGMSGGGMEQLLQQLQAKNSKPATQETPSVQTASNTAAPEAMPYTLPPAIQE